MWKISEKLRKSLNAFRAAEPRSYARRFQSRPSIRRLEQRRVLNAEFSLDGSTLTLENFQNNVNDLTIANDVGGDYTFTLSDGVWSEAAGSDANGFTGAGTDTLTVDPADVLAMLVNDSGSAVDFGVLLDDPNFAGDTLELAGVGPVSQTLLAPMTFDTLTLNADNGSFEVPSLILVGDLVVENATDISDGVDASIDVSGNASFTATNNITLANEDSGGNELIVGGTASFTSTNGDIRVGVEDGAPDPSQGALANVQISSIELTTGGSFTVVSDNDLTEVSADVDPSSGAEEYNLNVSGDPGFVFDVTDNGDDLLINEVDTPITLSITTRTGDLLVDEVNVANELTLKTDDGSIHVRDLGVTVGGAAKLDSSEAIVLEASVTGTTVGLVAGTNITQDPNGIITATELLVMAENVVLLDVANNNVDIIAADVVNDVDPAVDGVFRFRSIAGLTVGSVTIQGMTVTGVTAAAEAKIRADDNAALTSVDLQLDEAVQAGLVGLIADGNITQAATGVVTTGTAADEGLYLMAGGDVLLEEQNAIAGLAAEADQFIRVNTTVDLFVRELTFVERDLQPPLGAMVTSAAMGPLAGATAAAEVKLTSDQSIVALEAIVAPAVWLAAGQDITQRLNGEIRGLDAMNPADLVVIAGRTVLLDQFGNSVDSLAADVEGFFRLNTIESLNVTQLTLPMRAIGDATSAAMGPVVGVNSAVEAKLLSDGAITLSEDIGAPTVFLKAATDITQVLPARVRGTLSTESAELLAMAGGDILLANPLNRISAVNSAAAGTTRIATITDLAIRSLTTGEPSITTPAPDNEPIMSSRMSVTGNAGGIVKYESAGSISIETGVVADKLGLVAGANITQDIPEVFEGTEVLNVDELLLMSGGNALVDDAENKIGTVAADIGDGAGDTFRLLSTETLTVGQVTVIDMTITGVSSDADANDATPGLINEVKLTVQGADRDLFLENAVQGNRVGLVAGRSLAQTAQGVITTGTDLMNHGLLVMAEVDALLDQADNVVREVVGDVNGAFRFRTIANLTVGDVTIDGMQIVGISADANANLGAANRSAEVKLTADDGNAATSVTLNLAQGVQANLVGLIADGDITQTATGLITTGVETVLGNGLFVMAGGDVLLGEDNSVTRLAANVDVDPMVDGTDQDLRLKTTTNLVVGTLGFEERTVGAITSAMMPAFAGIQADGFAKLIAGGTIDIERMVTAAQVGLVAEGTITQDTAGVITTDELLLITPMTGTITRHVILDAVDNAVSQVAADVTGDVRLKTTLDLTVGTITIDGMTVRGISADGNTFDGPLSRNPAREVKLVTDGSLNLSQAIEANRVFFMAGSTVDQEVTTDGMGMPDGEGIVVANTLLIDAGSSVTLELDNFVDNFAAEVDAGHVYLNTLSFLDVVNDEILGMRVDGVTAVDFAKLISGSALSPNTNLRVQAQVTADTVGLVAANDITQDTTGAFDGRIIAPKLLVMAGSDIILQDDNEVGEIAADVDGNLYFRSINDLTVGAVTIDANPVRADITAMTVTGISADGDTADGMETPVFDTPTDREVRLEADGPAGDRTLLLDQSVEGERVFLKADRTISQINHPDPGVDGLVIAAELMLEAGGDITLPLANDVRIAAADIVDGSLVLNSERDLTIGTLMLRGPAAPDLQQTITGIEIQATSFNSLRLDITAGGTIDQQIAAPVDVDVAEAKFTVAGSNSILLADIGTMTAELDDPVHRSSTQNRFFNDLSGMESKLVFATKSNSGRIANLTVFDQTAVVLEDTDVLPDGTAIDITGDLTIIAGRSPEAGLIPTGLAIGSTAAVKVEGEAQFHAFGGTGPTDQSINLPNLAINTHESGVPTGMGNLAVTTDDGSASLKNAFGVNFRDDLSNTIAGNLQVTTAMNAITDEADAVLTVTGLAELITETPSDIFLGDGAAKLDLNHLEIDTFAANVSLDEENGLTLQDIKAQGTLYVASASGHIFQDINQANGIQFPVPTVSTRIEATSAAFSTLSGAVVLRDTAIQNLAVNSGEMFEFTQQNLTGLSDINYQLVRVGSSTLENPAGVDSLNPVEFKAGIVDERDVDTRYAFFVGKNSTSNLMIGQAIADPATGDVVQGIRTPNGNVFLESAGNITFDAVGVTGATSEGKVDTMAGPMDRVNVAVDIVSNFVFTAVATEELKIVAGTELVSYQGRTADGVVKDVHTTTAYRTFDGRLDPNNDTEDKAGPRFIITDPAPGFDAATSREVGRNPDGRILQRVQIDVGTAGEKGFFGDVLWADGLTGVVPDPAPANRIDLAIVGERESLMFASLEKDAENNPIGGGDLTEDVFNATESSMTEKINLEHAFLESFFVGNNVNRNFPRLPTEIRVFNASSINLFESGGARNLNRSISTESESSPANGDGPAEAVAPDREDNFVSPIQRIIGVAPDFQQIFIPLVPPIYMPVIVVSEDRPFALEKNDFDPPRVVDPQEGLVKYGYLGEDQELDEKDSKTWPDGVTESFIQDIKAQVRQGNLIEFPLGDYIIRVERTEGGKVEEIRFKKTADQSGDGQPDIEDQVPLPGFDQSASNQVPGANENEAQVSLPTNAEDSWVDAWRVWGDEAQPLNSENAVDPLRQKETNRNANEERARRLRHQRAVEQLNLRQVEQEQEEELSLDWKMGPPNEPGRPADFVAGTSLVAGALVMAKYHGNARGNQWREAWTRQVFSRWRR